MYANAIEVNTMVCMPSDAQYKKQSRAEQSAKPNSELNCQLYLGLHILWFMFYNRWHEYAYMHTFSSNGRRNSKYEIQNALNKCRLYAWRVFYLITLNVLWRCLFHSFGFVGFFSSSLISHHPYLFHCEIVAGNLDFAHVNETFIQ